VTSEFFSLMPQNARAKANWSACRNHIIAAALLHDTIEDAFVTQKYLKADVMSVMTVVFVEIVTKRPGENYFDFIMRISNSGHVGAKMVKLADLQHNMSDLQEGSMKDKYRFAQYLLNYFNHDK
jgi:(p)ppGpp synthase/HD superfamily hydrolase